MVWNAINLRTYANIQPRERATLIFSRVPIAAMFPGDSAGLTLPTRTSRSRMPRPRHSSFTWRSVLPRARGAKVVPGQPISSPAGGRWRRCLVDEPGRSPPDTGWVKCAPLVPKWYRAADLRPAGGHRAGGRQVMRQVPSSFTQPVRIAPEDM